MTRPVRLALLGCGTVQVCTAAMLDHAVATLRVEVDATGAARSVTVTKDPGHGFGREARRCALRCRATATPTPPATPVIVNEGPTFRLDHTPYGGIKASGNTREGPAWAVREMTERRLLREWAALGDRPEPEAVLHLAVRPRQRVVPGGVALVDAVVEIGRAHV